MESKCSNNSTKKRSLSEFKETNQNVICSNRPKKRLKLSPHSQSNHDINTCNNNDLKVLKNIYCTVIVILSFESVLVFNYIRIRTYVNMLTSCQRDITVQYQ